MVFRCGCRLDLSFKLFPRGGFGGFLRFPLSTLGSQMKRSVGPRYWAPRPSHTEGPQPTTKGLRPLVEGPASSTSRPTTAEPIAAAPIAVLPDKVRVKPYGRGSLTKALSLVKSDPKLCADRLLARARADTADAPASSREKIWAELATAAGFADPFTLSPEMIYTVMGALDGADYRSAELYLDVARQRHITSGAQWTQQLALAARRATRACRRGRGPAKQAQPLPLANLHQVSQQMAPAHPQGPQFPARATLISSWWLLREIEASNAEIDHVSDITDEKLIHWRLPSSKADWVALGATRSHSCCCPGNISDPVCPYHALSAQLEFASSLPRGRWLFPTLSGDQPSKAGWVSTFEWVASQVGEPLETPTGARRFTGHSARATGAVHLAKTQVELWRIQLFGRWGSEAFKLYVRNAPLTQLHLLAQESSVQTALSAARAELASLVKQLKSDGQWLAAQPIAQQPIQCYLDCEASAPISPAVKEPESLFVVNRRRAGKLHRVTHHGKDIQHYLWHTACFWYFARHDANYSLSVKLPDSAPKCAKCFRLTQDTDSTSTTDSESSCASAGG